MHALTAPSVSTHFLAHSAFRLPGTAIHLPGTATHRDSGSNHMARLSVLWYGGRGEQAASPGGTSAQSRCMHRARPKDGSSIKRVAWTA